MEKITIMNNDKIMSINCKEISEENALKFFHGYDNAILIEDDKDTYEDLMKIIKSGDKNNNFFIHYIEKEERYVSACLSFVSKNIIDDEYLNYNNFGMIIYVYTEDKYRKQKFASTILKHLFKQEKKCLWFCEVLDNDKITKEKNIESFTCEERDHFWTQLNFNKLDFEYHNPVPDLQNDCNGILSYNKLLIMSDYDYLPKKYLEVFMYNYSNMDTWLVI